jgi:hypothetical protein
MYDISKTKQRYFIKKMKQTEEELETPLSVRQLT